MFAPTAEDAPKPGSRVKRSQHPFQYVQQKRDGSGDYLRVTPNEASVSVERGDFLQEIFAFVQDLAEEGKCCVTVVGKACKCNCLSFLKNKDAAQLSVAKGLQNVFDLETTHKNALLCLEYRYATQATTGTNGGRSRGGPQRKYLLPTEIGKEELDFPDEMDGLQQHLICEAAWTTLHNLKQTAFDTVKDRSAGTQSYHHGNRDKRGVSSEHEEAYAFIFDKLNQLIEEFCEPHAHRIIQDLAGQSTIKEDTNDYLPPNFNKFQCYRNICYESGWILTPICRKKRKFEKIKNWELREGFYRTQEQLDAARESGAIGGEEGEVAKPIVSWTSFHRYWKNNFPNLVVRSKGEDTCTDCARLHNELQELYGRETNLMKEIRRQREDPGSDPGLSPDVLADRLEEIKEKIVEVERHVKMHIAQRELFNKYKALAKKDIDQKTPIDEATIMAVIDMAQNGAVPFLADNQVGDFYYMSPLIHYIFGVCEAARGFMHTYIWEEGTGDRGANNIITCLYMWLVTKGIVPRDADELASWNKPKLHHLVIGADNCTGQNKNKAMIKFCTWLVEAGYVEKVTLLFLIKGHTKNDCDRHFNELKMGTHNKNIWDATSLDAAYTARNKDSILLQRVEDDDQWKAWDDSLNHLYRDPDSGSITRKIMYSNSAPSKPILQAKSIHPRTPAPNIAMQRPRSTACKLPIGPGTRKRVVSMETSALNMPETSLGNSL